ATAVLRSRFRRPSSAEPALTIGTFGGNQAWIASEKDLGFHTMQSGQTAGATRMRILANGNVGIGKDNPATTLDVNGTATATSFSGSGTGLTNLNASNLASGTIPDARLSAKVALMPADGLGANTFSNHLRLGPL